MGWGFAQIIGGYITLLVLLSRSHVIYLYLFYQCSQWLSTNSMRFCDAEGER